MKKTIFVTAVSLSILSLDLFAIHRGANDLPYGQAMQHPLDQPVNDKYDGKAFFMNLGPTGIRGRIDPEAPTAFKVMFVFQDSNSPAKGKINIGDMIVGAGGKLFKTPHGFHRKQAGSRGWQGPPFELAQAIEDSQGKDGQLKLSVLPGGKKSGMKTVTLQLKAVGRFAKTYPWNCPRSDKLLKDLLDFVFQDGLPGGRPAGIQSKLALWASGDKRAIPIVKQQAESLMKGRPSPTGGGFCCWGWGFNGIFLGEYYNAFKDSGVKKAAEALNECYDKGMDWTAGSYSHRPYPVIQRRIASGGPKGYGAMAPPGGLAMLAMSIFKQTGLPYREEVYNRIHQSYLGAVGKDGSGAIAYGFGGGNTKVAMIRLKSGGAQCKAPEGVGFLVPTGMKYAKDFEVEKWYQEGSDWKKKLVPPTGEFAWIKSEADKLRVYESGYYLDSPPENRPDSKGEKVHQRRVMLATPHSEITGPLQNNKKGGGHNAPVGLGALAHYIGNKGNKPWNWLGNHMATCCAYSPETTWDGHASAELCAFWNILGAFRADEKDLRHFLEYYKTLIILSETHEPRNKGGMVEQPFGCQRNATCSIARNRKIYTYNTILLLSIPKRKLLITGADFDQPAPKTTAVAHSASVAPLPPPRKARSLSAHRRAALDKALLNTLTGLSRAKLLKPLPLTISKTRAKVTLVEANSDGSLILQMAGGSRTADFQFNELTHVDRATLSLLVAALKTTSTDAQAMAGVYMESLRRLPEADNYYAKAGEASSKKFEKLFD